jgi:hypothetical protein
MYVQYPTRERCGYLVEQLCYGFPDKGARYYETRKKVGSLTWPVGEMILT